LANFFARAFSAIFVIDQPTNGMVASNPGFRRYAPSMHRDQSIRAAVEHEAVTVRPFDPLIRIKAGACILS